MYGGHSLASVYIPIIPIYRVSLENSPIVISSGIMMIIK